jgi:hypothetical protein
MHSLSSPEAMVPGPHLFADPDPHSDPTFELDPDPDPAVTKVKQICNPWYTVPQGLPLEPPPRHCKRPWPFRAQF